MCITSPHTPALELCQVTTPDLQGRLGNVVQQHAKEKEEVDLGEMDHRFCHTTAPDVAGKDSANKPSNP